METGISVLDAMTKAPVSISPTQTIEHASKLMLDHKVGSLLVMEKNTLVGILTEGDLVRRVMTKNLRPSEIVVKTIMSTNLITITPELDIYDAIMTMHNFDIRHAPVVSKGNIVGFLTMKDVLKIEPALFDVIVDKIKLREELDKPVYADIRMRK
jgi:CBS domain-containing protein